MTATLISFEAHRYAKDIEADIESFLNDPPDSDYQRGYLAALMAVYAEVRSRGTANARFIAGDRLLEPGRDDG